MDRGDRRSSSGYSRLSAALSGAFSLGPTRQFVGATYRAFLTPEGGPDIDFMAPMGEAALVLPDSVSWRVFKNPITLFMGGVAAVLMELAEPRVCDGVWQHSSFRVAPKDRLQRTGLAAMVTVYGAKPVAEQMIAGVVRRHEAVTGQTPEGLSYSANDPALLDWVQATASYGFIEAYARYAAPLTAAERDRYYAEAAPAARLYGAVGAPRSDAGIQHYFEEMQGRLSPSPAIAEFLRILKAAPLMPRAARLTQGALIRAATAIVPQSIWQVIKVGTEWSPSPNDLRLARLMAEVGDQIVVAEAPAVKACLRLGLPDDYLYTSS